MCVCVTTLLSEPRQEIDILSSRFLGLTTPIFAPAPCHIAESFRPPPESRNVKLKCTILIMLKMHDFGALRPMRAPRSRISITFNSSTARCSVQYIILVGYHNVTLIGVFLTDSSRFEVFDCAAGSSSIRAQRQHQSGVS